MPTDWTIKQQPDGSWHAWPHGEGPLRAARGKGWRLVQEIKAGGGAVHWETYEDVERFKAEFGDLPEGD